MAGRSKPDLIIIGQLTVDHVVPAEPACWRRQMGGSSLYAVAGARLWLDPARIGIVARRGSDYPFDAQGLLRTAGLRHVELVPVRRDHLVEWLIYEPDGSRRSLPRNRSLLDVGAEGASSREAYLRLLLEISPSAADVPPAWLPAAGVHLCPQVGTRHRESVVALRNAVARISVDPSPHYSRDMDARELGRHLSGISAFMPSVQEVRPQLEALSPEGLALELHRAGFPEVLIKRAEHPVVVAHDGIVDRVATVVATVVDPTGAGDSFCGAYAACRLLGHSPGEAARSAAATAALIVGCTGVESALSLTTASLRAASQAAV
jgi:pfkB family carbohydrate kinase